MVSVRGVLLAAGGLAAAASMGVGAQQVYRIVGPDGRVTFSDRPPADARAEPAPTVAMPQAGGNGALPFELRQVTSRYPVTLYTGTNCAPCDLGRGFLQRRGVPFTERTVGSNDDVAALQRISGDTRLPFMTIGGQQLRGYSETEWAQFLDAAGYPRSSRLPGGWRNPAPAPLVAVQQPAPAVEAPATAEAPPQQPALPVPDAEPANPAGIRF